MTGDRWSTRQRSGAHKPATSKRVDQFCDHICDKLDGVEVRVIELKAKVDSDREATKAAIDKDVHAAEATLVKVKDDADAARARMKAQLQENKAVTQDVIGEWKRNREVDKLERRLGQTAQWTVRVYWAQAASVRLW